MMRGRPWLAAAGALAAAAAIWAAPPTFGDGGTQTGRGGPEAAGADGLEPVDWGAPDVEAFELRFTPIDKWTILTPNPTAPAFEGAVPLPSASGGGFKFELTPRGPYVDTDGDGAIDAPVQGVVVFKTRVDGEEGRYAALIKRGETGYTFTRSCVMAGTVKGTRVALVDENNDGRYDAYGADAMLVGGARAAAHLSRVVNLGGKPWHFKIDPLGRRALVREYRGKSGKIDLETGWKATGTLFSAIVSAGEVSFNLAGLRGGLLVPAVDYRLESGLVGSSPYATARIDGSGVGPLAVRDGEEKVLAWGTPGKIDFTYRRDGAQVKVDLPLRWTGLAGETYGSWKPSGMTVQVKYRDAAGREQELPMSQDDAIC